MSSMRQVWKKWAVVPSLLLSFLRIVYLSLVVVAVIADYVPWTWVDV